MPSKILLLVKNITHLRALMHINLEMLNLYTHQDLEMNRFIIQSFHKMLEDVLILLKEKRSESTISEIVIILHKVKPTLKLFGVKSETLESMEEINSRLKAIDKEELIEKECIRLRGIIIPIIEDLKLV